MMSWTINRKELDGTVVVVGFADDPIEIGLIIDDDRAKVDYEPQYQVTED